MSRKCEIWNEAQARAPTFNQMTFLPKTLKSFYILTYLSHDYKPIPRQYADTWADTNVATKKGNDVNVQQLKNIK